MKSKKFPGWLTIESKDRTLFFSLTAVYGFYILPILLANRPYQDDLSRSLRGITGWNNDARPLTERLVTWLCGGFPIGDVHPLPLILSILLLAYTVTLYAKRYLSAENRTIPAVGIGFLAIANPFLLSNLSYRFDCVTMILALCAAILPYVIPAQKALWEIFLFSLFMCLVTLTTYQPACGVFISFWFLELFFMLFSERLELSRLIVRGASCLFSVLLYKYVVLNRYIYSGTGSWQPDAYRFAWHSENGFFSSLALNFETFTRFLDRALRSIPTPLLLLLTLLTVGGMAVTGKILWGQEKKTLYKLFSLVYLVLLPVFVTLGAVAPLLVLKHSNFCISAHALLCLSGVGVWVGIMISALYIRLPRLCPLLFLPCMLFGLTFSYSYGNAMTSQKQYEEYLTYSIAHDIETLNADGAFETLTISGKAPRSPQAARLCEKYALFPSLIPTYLTNSSYLGGALLLHYTQESFSFEGLTEEDQNLIDTAAPSLENSIYACYENEDKLIILFK